MDSDNRIVCLNQVMVAEGVYRAIVRLLRLTDGMSTSEASDYLTKVAEAAEGARAEDDAMWRLREDIIQDL